MQSRSLDRNPSLPRANLDGTDVNDVLRTGLVSPKGIALDTKADRLCWTDFGPDKVGCARMDGSHAEPLVGAGKSPWGIALDPYGSHMYWADYGTDTILRASLDGLNVEDIITTGLIAPVGIALDQRRSGDFDLDGDVDLGDYAQFQVCYTDEVAGQLQPQCVFFDLKIADGDVDHGDFAGFCGTFTGP